MGEIPAPLMETFSAMAVARAIIVGTELDIFEVLEHGSLTANEVSLRCSTISSTTEDYRLQSLFFLLASFDTYKILNTIGLI